MCRDNVEYGAPHVFAILVAMEVLNVRAVFDAVVLLVIKMLPSRKGAAHANAGHYKMARSGLAEVKVPGLVQEGIDAGGHRVFKF